MILKTPIFGKKLNKIFFITEIASTHNGSVKSLKLLTNKILNSDTDYIKFQIFKNDDLCHVSSPLYKGLKKIEIKHTEWKKIINKCFIKKRVILEPFDEKSYIFCKKFKKKASIKISSSEHDNLNMISDSLKNFKEVFINISGFKMKEIIKLISKFKKYKSKFILMYGFQSFPSREKDLRLQIINELKNKKIKVGYADHSLTDDKILTYLLTSRAIGFGAKYIEKHITLKRSQKKPDYISSFEPKSINEYIKYFKKDHVFNFKKTISNNEKKYCMIMEKFAFAKENIPKNSNIKINQIKYLRTSKIGLSRYDIKKFINKKKLSLKRINENELLQKKFFREK